MLFRKQSHATYCCDYHVVFCTKYRRKWINNGIFAYFELKLKEINEHYPELEIKSVNHDEDHLHFLISIPPKYSVSTIIRIIKTNTANKLKQKFLILKSLYWGTNSIWSDGYFVSTLGINQAVIKQYIENQGKEDSGQAKLEL